MQGSGNFTALLIVFLWLTPSASWGQSDFWYTNRHDRIKIVIDEAGGEIRVSRLPGGQYTGKVERHKLDDLDGLLNSLERAGFNLERAPEPVPAPSSAGTSPARTASPEPIGAFREPAPTPPIQDTGHSDLGSEALWVVFWVSLYFLPTVFAAVNRKQNWVAVFLLNLLLGWTCVGWIIALVWGACKDPRLSAKPDGHSA